MRNIVCLTIASGLLLYDKQIVGGIISLIGVGVVSFTELRKTKI